MEALRGDGDPEPGELGEAGLPVDENTALDVWTNG